MENCSPWFNFERSLWPCLRGDLKCEIAIIGGGISGIATLFYLLTSTQKNVVLFEKNRVASGATGHNAGLAIAHIEKPASELAEVIGNEATRALFDEIDKAWDALHSIHDEIGLQDNLLSFPSATVGFNSLSHFFAYLKDNQMRHEQIQDHLHCLVSEHLKGHIPEEFSALVAFVPQQTILAALKTIDRSYIAAAARIAPFKGKRMNSAKFCYKVLEYLKEKFSHRFSLYEETDIKSINLHAKHAVLEHAHGEAIAQDVILCTNAYRDFSIWNMASKKPVSKLHDSITPRIGYLAAFPNPSSERYALGFLNEQITYRDVPFWYFSHAPHASHNLDHSCVIGGPEFELDASFSPEWVENKREISIGLIKNFLFATFKEPPVTFPFVWHGLMGYTPNGLRWVGPDSDYPHLWYNLACNGIGIVPAIAGAQKIAANFTDR